MYIYIKGQLKKEIENFWFILLTSDIERVQKSFLHIVLGEDYDEYKNALFESNLEMLSTRRTKLCKSFALKTSKHPKHHHWFAKTEPGPLTRSKKPAFKPPLCRLTRLKKSPIPYLTSLLNTFKKKKWTLFLLF